MSDAPPSVDVSAKPPRRFLRLRISASAFFAVLAVAMVVLWVRSYWRVDYVTIEGAHVDFDAGYIAGKLGVQVTDWNSPHGALSIQFKSKDVGAADLQRAESASGYMGFVYKWPGAFMIPLWLPTLVCVGLAALPWATWRFSLRALLIATTLVAVALGLAVCGLAVTDDRISRGVSHNETSSANRRLRVLCRADGSDGCLMGAELFGMALRDSWLFARSWLHVWRIPRRTKRSSL